jgi:hypothetical protein
MKSLLGGGATKSGFCVFTKEELNENEAMFVHCFQEFLGDALYRRLEF